MMVMVLMIRVIPDFPGGPVVKTLCFHCKKHRFKVQFLVMELRSFMSYVMAKKRKKKNIYIYISRSLKEQPQNLLWELKRYAKLSIPPWTTYNCWLFSFLRRAWFLPVDARGIKIFLDQDTCRPAANPPGVDSVAVVTVGPRETCCWTPDLGLSLSSLC